MSRKGDFDAFFGSIFPNAAASGQLFGRRPVVVDKPIERKAIYVKPDRKGGFGSVNFMQEKQVQIIAFKSDEGRGRFLAKFVKRTPPRVFTINVEFADRQTRRSPLTIKSWSVPVDQRGAVQ